MVSTSLSALHDWSEATPAATPAWDRGMPDTVLLVIGALAVADQADRAMLATSTIVGVAIVR